MGSGFAKKKKEAKLMQEQLSKMQNQMQTMESCRICCQWTCDCYTDRRWRYEEYQN